MRTININRSVFIYIKYLIKNDTTIKKLFNNINDELFIQIIENNIDIQKKIHNYVNNNIQKLIINNVDIFCDLISNILYNGTNIINTMSCINSYDIILNHNKQIGMTGTP